MRTKNVRERRKERKKECRVTLAAMAQDWPAGVGRHPCGEAGLLEEAQDELEGFLPDGVGATTF